MKNMGLPFKNYGLMGLILEKRRKESIKRGISALINKIFYITLYPDIKKVKKMSNTFRGIPVGIKDTSEVTLIFSTIILRRV